jgi:hypothetical protein
MKKKFVFELKLESPSEKSESDYKNFIIFIPSRNSSLTCTCCQLRVIGDHHHVLKSSFVFSKFLHLPEILSGHELKWKKSPALMENVWSSGWELE